MKPRHSFRGKTDGKVLYVTLLGCACCRRRQKKCFPIMQSWGNTISPACSSLLSRGFRA